MRTCHLFRFRTISASLCRRAGSRRFPRPATDLYSFSPGSAGGYLAFLGRISPEKRPDRAIEIASRAGAELKIAAKVDKVDQAYFER